MQARKSFDYYFSRGSLDATFPQITKPSDFSNAAHASYLNLVQYCNPSQFKQDKGCYKSPSSIDDIIHSDSQLQLQNQLQQQVNPIDLEDANAKKTKRRRRRTVYTSRRNLHCLMCGVTETPEWRRGPTGDHTLCNACGLHYAKSLKKQKKEQEGRKHSIEMLLNQSAVPPTKDVS